jgi:glycosyltransferase involved in cell wall biosynthesis
MTEAVGSPVPALSIVIPARDAAATIDAQLEALLAEDWLAPFEVVVVNNGSRDATTAIVERYAARDARVRLVDASDRRGVSHTRNVGLAAARSELVAMCDADDIVAPGWVSAMGSALRENEFVTGPLDVDRLNPAWVAGARGRAIESGPGDFRGVFPFAHSCNLGFRKSVVTRYGGFDERLSTGEDIELSFRLWQAGTPLTYVPDAIVHYRYRATMRALWEQSRSHARVAPVLERRVRDAGIALAGDGEGRRWLWLARHAGMLGSRRGRAQWVSVAGGRVGRLEGRWSEWRGAAE